MHVIELWLQASPHYLKNEIEEITCFSTSLGCSKFDVYLLLLYQTNRDLVDHCFCDARMCTASQLDFHLQNMYIASHNPPSMPSAMLQRAMLWKLVMLDVGRNDNVRWSSITNSSHLQVHLQEWASEDSMDKISPICVIGGCKSMRRAHERRLARAVPSPRCQC
jgi:hypothetical protein